MSESKTPAQATSPAGSADFQAINVRAQNADAQKLQCYKDAVALIEKHASAYVDGETRKLKPGTLATLTNLMPALNATTLSTAWTAFVLDPTAFSTVSAQRGFVDLVKAHKDKSAAQASTASKSAAQASENLMETALIHAKEAIKEAASAGVSPATLADLIKMAYAKPSAPAQTQTPAQDAPAPQ